MFHVELRKFPHNACAFNLSEAELRELLEPWSREQWVELGERKWNPNEARLTVLEGPHLEVENLAMGQGWRNAQHHSQDVTERVLAQARSSQQTPSPGERATPDAAASDASGAVGAELRSLLGPDPDALLAAWRLAAQRRPELSPSESLALAERTLRSLDS
jgi:hypothetical protein